MTGFQDIFKSSFLENVTAISITDILITLVMSFCLGIYIFLIYKKSYAGVMYSSSFGVTLVALCMITAMTILAVTSNVVLSLGMVGALSIVRFRTAVKEPMDLIFLFWAIAGGIVLAAGMIPLAIIGSLFIGIVLVILANKKSFVHPYILSISLNDSNKEEEINNIIKTNAKKYSLKNKTVRTNLIELNYEIRLKSDNTSFINDIEKLNGIDSAILVSYNGDFMG